MSTQKRPLESQGKYLESQEISLESQEISLESQEISLESQEISLESQEISLESRWMGGWQAVAVGAEGRKFPRLRLPTARAVCTLCTKMCAKSNVRLPTARSPAKLEAAPLNV